MPKMVTIRVAAEQTGLTYSCLRRWILEGKFRYFVRSGSKFLINLDRLIEFLNSPAGENEHPATVAGVRR